MILQGLMVVALGLGFAADDNAEKIVGVWTTINMKDKKEVDITVEFTKDGKFKASRVSNSTGKKTMEEGVYSIKKDQLSTTFKSPEGKDYTEVVTIKEVTKDRLILISGAEKTEVVTFKRK